MKVNHAPILLVENDPNDVVLVQRAFQRAEIDVDIDAVGDVPQARAYLTACAERGPHALPLLVLLDLKMPGADGIELVRWIRSQPDIRRIPVVILSSSREQRDVLGAYEAGCNSYLVKPVAFLALQTMLTTFGHYWLNFNTLPHPSAREQSMSDRRGE